jgi:hypothetical protein
MKQNIFNARILSYSILASALFSLPYAAFAATEYAPLVGIPRLDQTANTGLPEYINAVYLLIVGAGALIGVVKIAMAGIKWSLSDIVTHKSDAIEDIKGVLLGLALLVIPFVVLNEINPNITRLDVLSGLPKVNMNTKAPNQSTQTLPNTAEQLAKDTYTSNLNNPPASKDEWRFVGVKRDFCGALAKERNQDLVFTATGGGGTLGVCELYPKP